MLSACTFPFPPTILEGYLTVPSENMKTILSFSKPAELETESLVALVLDHADKDPSQSSKNKNKDTKQQLKLDTDDAAVQSVAADLLASGEVSCKPLEINLRFGARVSALRTQSELPQEELALKLGVSVSHLIDLETGRKSASIIDLDGLAQQFKMSIAELLTGL